MPSHVTGDDITGGQGAELTSAQLVFLMVQSLGPALSSHILSSVGGVQPEKGEELHSLMIRLDEEREKENREERKKNHTLCNKQKSTTTSAA